MTSNYVYLFHQDCNEICGGESEYGVCFVDTSIGKFYVSTINNIYIIHYTL